MLGGHSSLLACDFSNTLNGDLNRDVNNLKSVKNTHGGALLSVKLQALSLQLY